LERKRKVSHKGRGKKRGGDQGLGEEAQREGLLEVEQEGKGWSLGGGKG